MLCMRGRHERHGGDNGIDDGIHRRGRLCYDTATAKDNGGAEVMVGGS
ncbi:MAG TPA: hypothetical protein VM283_00565 [Armatimonadota bacterium]|nr:hypothetical protein [Armatimonadota bacterium]